MKGPKMGSGVAVQETARLEHCGWSKVNEGGRLTRLEE